MLVQATVLGRRRPVLVGAAVVLARPALVAGRVARGPVRAVAEMGRGGGMSGKVRARRDMGETDLAMDPAAGVVRAVDRGVVPAVAPERVRSLESR